VLLLLTSPPRTLRAVGGGSAAGPSHSRHFAATQQFGRFSNRPFRVKRFQTIRRRSVSISLTGSCFSSESAQGPSIMGFEDEAEQSFGRPCQQANGRSKRPSELTSSIVPRGTSFHRRVEFGFPPIAVDPLRRSCRCYGSHAAATSRVQRKSVPSTQMRCRITANRRASATIAFLIPRCRAIFIAQALSQDHLLVRVSMTWAAS
jgi:hypothetical protein